MKRVTGIGGIFLQAKDAPALQAWYQRHLGIDVDLVRTVLLIAVGAAVGATVGAAGVIAFVGLLVPFIVVRVTGPLHRHLLVASVGGGALFVAAADLLARLAIQPIELPVGLVTAALGGPVFLWLLTRPSHDV